MSFISKISFSIPFLAPIGTRTFSRIKKTAAETATLNFSEKFGAFFGEGYPHVRLKTEIELKEGA